MKTHGAGIHGMFSMSWAFGCVLQSQTHGTKTVPWLPARTRVGESDRVGQRDEHAKASDPFAIDLGTSRR